jgi:hypothetical protein
MVSQYGITYDEDLKMKKNEWHKTRAKVVCLSLLWQIRKTLPNES